MEEQGTDGQPAGVPPASENATKFPSTFEFSLPADFATTRPGMGHEELESEALRLFLDKFTSWANEVRVRGQLLRVVAELVASEVRLAKCCGTLARMYTV